MRLAWLVLAAGSVGVLPAGQASSIDVPVGELRVHGLDAADCDIWRTVEHVARFSGVRVGFEHARNCAPDGRSRSAAGQVLTMDGWTPRQAFDYVVQQRPAFSWRLVEDVVVIRPDTAWSEPGNVLDRPVAPFDLRHEPPHLALHALLAAARPSLYLDHADARTSYASPAPLRAPAVSIDTPIDVRFRGGTLLQALNAVAKPSGATWELGYWGKPHVALYAPDYDGGMTGLSMRAP
ncbi:MAG: hypothetical protein R2745_08670 [Vicinamibacterales bacterium]